jgi:single-stranded DNA-binding protein
MAQQESKLEQTKSYFSLKGIVSKVNDNFKEDTIQNGKNAGKEYKSIRFFVQTSPQNKLQVELFGMELDYVYPFKRGKKGEKGTVLRDFPFSKRHNLPQGYTLIGVNVELEKDEKGKLIRKSMIDFDAVEEIYNNLNDGESVHVTGEISFGTYVNSQGDEVDQTRYQIKSIKLINDIDFDAEGFVEENSFEQEIVFVGADVDKDAGCVYVTGHTIQYGGKFTTKQFVIRPNGNKEIAKTAKVFSSNKMSFGDFVKVYGVCLNLSVEEEIEDEVVEVELDFGGVKPKGVGEKRAITTYITELQITGADGTTYKKEKYTEEDFVVDELVDKDSANPWDDDEDEEDGTDISDDDLPF